MKKLVIVLAMFCCACDSDEPENVESFAIAGNSRSDLERAPYIIYADSSEIFCTPVLECYLDYAIKRLETFFSDTLNDQFKVFVHKNREQFNKEANVAVGATPVGVGSRDQMHLLAPSGWDTADISFGINITSGRIWQRSKVASRVSRSIYQLVTHELVHVFHGQERGGYNIDSSMRWYNEGIAVYASAQLDGWWRDSVYHFAKDNPVSLLLLSDCKYHYELSGSLVAYLDQQYGRQLLCDMLLMDTSYELFKRIEISEEELISGWKANLKQPQ